MTTSTNNCKEVINIKPRTVEAKPDKIRNETVNVSTTQKQIYEAQIPNMHPLQYMFIPRTQLITNLSVKAEAGLRKQNACTTVSLPMYGWIPSISLDGFRDSYMHPLMKHMKSLCNSSPFFFVQAKPHAKYTMPLQCKTNCKYEMHSTLLD